MTAYENTVSLKSGEDSEKPEKEKEKRHKKISKCKEEENS